jgi:predicted RNA-binding Zn-ribbon protein involved in translation (DUF1610 family)
MTVQCPNGHGEMVESEVTFERQTPHGLPFRMVVPGFRCPICGEEVITGEQAERVSFEWNRLATTLMVSNDVSEAVLPLSQSSPELPGRTEENATAAHAFALSRAA